MERKISGRKFEEGFSKHYLEPISHDGVHDSLTHLPATGFFYEILFREIARAERDQQSLTLIRFKLFPSSDVIPSSHFEVALINFARALNKISRACDINARIGRLEFFSLLTISASHHREFVSRIEEIWHEDNFKFRYEFVTLRSGESLIQLLNRLDEAESNIPL
jgi:GGDEF domain-containing protein